jgi:hypothetical protein
MIISGSAAVPGGPPATKDSPVRNTILSLMVFLQKKVVKKYFD